MTEPFLELAYAVRHIEEWGWCGAAATEVGLIAASVAHKSEADCVAELATASAGVRNRRGARRLRARRGDHREWTAAARTAYQTAGNGLEQLWEYISTGRQRMDAPLDQRAGTEFQRKTWDVLRALPFGETRTYAWVARAAGRPDATRAVGTAVGTNRLLIFVPCHRVVAVGGLGGYSRGTAVKRRLLDHEQAWPRMQTLFSA